MELKSFESHIPPAILQTGKNYYENGRIEAESFEEVEDGLWMATVIDAEEYFVEIEINKQGTVKECMCDCPYEGDLCKHVVAVLYAIRDEQTLKLKEKQTIATKREKKLPFQGLVKKISSDELKAFILKYGKINKRFKADFSVYFAEKDENFDLGKQVRDQIQNRINTYTKKQFIDYNSTYKLAEELEDILLQGQNFISQKNLLFATKLVMVYIQEVMPTISYADDSSGSLGDAINSGVVLLTEIALQAPTDLKAEIAAFLKMELRRDEYFDYGDFGENLVNLYAQLCIDIGKIDEFLGFIDVIIDKARLYMSKYQIDYFTKLKASVLVKGNRTGGAQ